MPRNRGTFNYTSNFEPLVKAPIDARMRVQNYSDLIDPSTWRDLDGNIWLFDGALVVVANEPEGGVYWLKDSSNYADYASWEKAGKTTGVLNIGDGSAHIFAGYDSSDNIQLRTLKGAGAAIVQEVGDTIIISLDASFAGEINYGQNIGLGDASVYSGKVGDALQFREIKGLGSITVSTSDNIILIDSSGGTGGEPTYDTSLDDGLSMPTTVGGIPSGTTVADLKGDTLISLWDDLLFPTVNPTYVLPNNTFDDAKAILQEIDNILNITYTATFSKGQILVSGSFQDFRSGDPVNYNYTDPSGNTLLVDASSASLVNSQTVNGYRVLIGNQVWGNTVDYLEGPQPEDNKGNPVDSPYPAGTTSNKSITMEGVYALYATISDIADPDEKLTPLNYSMLSGNNINISLPAESGGNKQSFDVAQAWEGAPTNRPLLGVEQYDSNFDVWNALSFSSFTKTSTTHGSVSYWRYTYNGATIGARLIRLKFS